MNCDGQVNSVDALGILRYAANLPGAGVCKSGDMDCSGAIDSADALTVLRFVAHLPVYLPDVCAPLA